MAFVKLDCGILDSTLWVDRDSREIFITALLMAAPFELVDPMPQIAIRSLDETGWTVPPGWYGLVPAAGIGIIRRAGLDEEAGYLALERMGAAEPDSRSRDFDGRRLVRVDGGFIVLNFIRYRERDHTAAERSKRYRERKDRNRTSRPSQSPSRVAPSPSRVASRSVTEAEAEAEADSSNGSRSRPSHLTDNRS